MVVIRLSRVGKKNSPAYRVTVADKQRAVKRKFIEVIGHYNPTTNPKELVINKDRALFWIGMGAQPSDTVRNLMADLGILKKSEKVNKKYAKPNKKKAKKEQGEEKTSTPQSDASNTEKETQDQSTEEKQPIEESASDGDNIEQIEEEPKVDAIPEDDA